MAIRVFFDTTVLCGATLSPGGVDMKLLQLARIREPKALLEPVITQQVMAEWEKNCRAGFMVRGKPFVVPEPALDAFVALLEPLLSREMIANVQLGRFEAPLYPVRRHSGLTMIQIPAKGVNPQKSQMLEPEKFALTDIGDFHVVDAALLYGCDYICSYNERDLPEGLVIGGRLTIVRPEQLHHQLVR